MALFLLCTVTAVHAAITHYPSITYYTSVEDPRPRWAGQVEIETDGTQIKSVKGIVVPSRTSGRPDPPNPLNGGNVGKTYSLDRGHLMALEMGGPDIAENIVPQQHTCVWIPAISNTC